MSALLSKRAFYATLEKPTVLRVNPDGVPAELRDRPQWVSWRLQWKQDKEKWDKPPINSRTNSLASSTDSSTWSTFDQTLRHYQNGRRVDGIGFVFTVADPYVGIDLDDAIDEYGVILPWARPIITDLDTYAENSPSATGSKLLARGRLPNGCGHKKKYKAGEIEVYDNERYFTITGHRLPGSPAEIHDRQGELDALLVLAKLIEKKQDVKPNRGPAPTSMGMTDNELIAKAKAAHNGAKFSRLWHGDTGEHNGDDSSADLALCSMLAFWTGNDPARIDGLFRQSGLMRGKWERQDYRDRTIGKALEDRTEFYDPTRNGYHAKMSTGSSSGTGGTNPTTTAAQPPNLFSQHLTDVGNCRRLVALHGQDMRFCHPWGKWLVWDGARWQEDEESAAQRLAKDTCRTLLETAARRAAELAGKLTTIENEEQRLSLTAEIERMHDLQTFALKSEAAGKITAMLDLSRSEPGIPILPAVLNSDPWALCCPNGVIDLRTGKLRDHRREDYITQVCLTPFDPSAKCPAWLKFLAEIFPGGELAEQPGNAELIGFIQRLLGYSLTATVGEQILPIFWGSGANGKSTLLTAVLNVLGDDYGGKAPTSMMMAHRGEHHPTELAGLFGKRLMVATETESGARLAESTVKDLTGGDKITARRMREDFWSFDPTHKLILATNHKPKVRGRDHAIWRRLRLIPFVQRFEKGRQDKRLSEKLATEAAGILAWMVRGCLDWQKNGLGEPEEVKTATAGYKQDEDVLAAWIAECCETGNTAAGTRGKDLYASYEAWCKQTGERYVMTARQLNEALREDGYEDYRNDGPAFRGIMLRLNYPN